MILCTAKRIQKRFRFECVDERIFFSFWEKNVEHNTTRKTPNFVPFSFLSVRQYYNLCVYSYATHRCLHKHKHLTRIRVL